MLSHLTDSVYFMVNLLHTKVAHTRFPRSIDTVSQIMCTLCSDEEMSFLFPPPIDFSLCRKCVGLKDPSSAKKVRHMANASIQ